MGFTQRKRVDTDQKLDPAISPPSGVSQYDPAMNPLAGVLSEAWGMYKTYAKHLLTIAFVIYVAAAIIAAILSLAGTFGDLLGSLVSIVAAFLLQATLVKAVQDVRDGRVDMSIGETVSAVVPYLGRVIVASVLAGIAIVIGLALIIAPGLYLITIWAVIVPVIVIEGVGALASFGRSRALVRGHGWHVFGTLVSPFLALVVTLVYYRLSGGAPTPPVPGENYGGFSAPPQAGSYGGFHEPPQGGSYGGFTEPPQGGSYGGFTEPPQPGENYGGYSQTPPDGGTYGGQQPS